MKVKKPVLLLYPPYEGKNILKSRLPFPVGPLYIAAYLESKGIKSDVVDFCFPYQKSKVRKPSMMNVKQSFYFRYGRSDVEMEKWLRKNLKKYHNVVGVSSLMSSTYNGGYQVVNLMKRIDPKTIVVIGGPHATAYPDHVIKYSKADYICIGEGEESFYKFLIDEEQHSIYDRNEIKVAIPKVEKFIDNLDSLPFPRRELLKDDREIKEIYITFSRGCPHRCSFCGSHLVQGRRWRNKSIATAIKEIEFYYNEWGVRKFVIEDDNLCPGKKGIAWLKEFCREIIILRKKLKFHVSHGLPVYAIADKELSELLWLAGFREMVFPLESTSPDVLKHMNKEFTPHNWESAIKNWSYEKNHPAEIILGYPFVETIETMLQTMIDISKKKGRVWASHFRLNKGTQIYDMCLEAEYIDNSYDPINTQSFYIETERFDLKDLAELMQISRGINFGTERDFDIFSGECVDAKFKDFRFVKVPRKIGDVVAVGKFSFKRSQDVFTSLILLKEMDQYKRPILKYVDGNKLIYSGDRSSNVYRRLKVLLHGKREVGTSRFFGGVDG